MRGLIDVHVQYTSSNIVPQPIDNPLLSIFYIDHTSLCQHYQCQLFLTYRQTCAIHLLYRAPISVSILSVVNCSSPIDNPVPSIFYIEYISLYLHYQCQLFPPPIDNPLLSIFYIKHLSVVVVYPLP